MMLGLTSKLESLSPRTRALIVILSIPALVALLWFGIRLPVQLVFESQSEWRDHSVKILARARGLGEQSKVLADRFKALPTAPIWSKFFAVTKSGSAESQLQSDVGSLLSVNRIPVQSLTPLRSTQFDAITAAGLRVSASMTVDQLKNLLAAVGSHPRYLRVDRLRINAPPMQTPEQNPMLTVTMDIYGMERVVLDRSGSDAVAATNGDTKA